MRPIDRNEAGTRAVRRMVRARIERAVKHLTGRTPSDEDLHAARKELRKARATLQLGRKALGHRVFARANTALRDAARPLGAVRDSKVLLDRLDEFAGRFGRGALDELRSTLRRERLQARRASLGAAALRTQRGRLRALAARSTRWPVGRHGWSVLGPAMERTYARGRRALAAARENPSVEHLHEWRKRVKSLCYQLQLLEPIAPEPIQRLARAAHRLSDVLGHDHDLALLRAKVVRTPETARPEHRMLLDAIDERRAREQALAFGRGRRLYRETPRTFAARLEAHWRAWKRNGESPAAGIAGKTYDAIAADRSESAPNPQGSIMNVGRVCRRKSSPQRRAPISSRRPSSCARSTSASSSSRRSRQQPTVAR